MVLEKGQRPSNGAVILLFTLSGSNLSMSARACIIGAIDSASSPFSNSFRSMFLPTSRESPTRQYRACRSVQHSEAQINHGWDNCRMRRRR